MESPTTTDVSAQFSSWLQKLGKREARKDRIVGSNLFGEIVAALFISTLLWFFIAHKLEETGFYTDDFGALEMSLMYSSGAFAVLLAVLRILVRRRNILRPLDVASFLLFSIAHAVLLISFPFNFDHVTAVLPGALEWTVGWISEPIGKLLLALGLVGGLIGAVFTLLIYLGARKELSEAPLQQESVPPTID